MVAYAYGIPVAETNIDKIKGIIDNNLHLSDSIKAEGGPREATHLLTLDRNLTIAAREILQLFGT